MALSSKFFTLVVLLSLLVFSPLDVAKAQPIAAGLSWSFYARSCPNVESIIRNRLQRVFRDDVGQAAGILRLHFHDCFVQGCDGSVLLDGSASGPSEKSAIPNLTLRPQAFAIINDLSRRVQSECGRVVSCSDIVALAARDAVFLTGGPNYSVPLGRRDSLNFATQNATIDNLVAPTANTTIVLTKLAAKNLNATDAVALSGAHTIGIAHCASFTNRLYPNQDPTMDQTLANNLKTICPSTNTNATTNMDIRTPNVFDNRYFVDLMNRQGLFTSDQDLYTDSRTREIVRSFAVNQTLFFEKFVVAILKMGQLNVLTGNSGEVRGNCSAKNSNNLYISSVVEDEGSMQASQF
ncbi:OLC1v1017646C1 [Oldenlandia corymbosa var. corymbosa]|uniref:Peroxidase n=1 Tax=Oldenlandia corymbosa var. corymbosa TaxID=529605 RepID=A0AAV1EA29_OLDCO|nr:OLC1v1017646C1 [Oldenlandia corymbosa var. corymbosa]